MQIDEALLAELPRSWQCVGCLPAFGSRHHDASIWFEVALLDQVPPALQQRVLWFDWWIRNMDRLAANTNLLWDANHKKLVMIDHNLAFDRDFDAAKFLDLHIFASQWPVIANDLFLRDALRQQMNEVMPVARWACNNAPPEWSWANAEMDVPSNFDPEDALATLARCATPELWRTE
nr:HipA family kinase [Rhizobacter sp. OV335]